MILAGSELLSPQLAPFRFSFSSPRGRECSQIPLALPGWLLYCDHVEKPSGGLTDGFVWLRQTKHTTSARQRRCDGNNSDTKRRRQINIYLSTCWFVFHFLSGGKLRSAWKFTQREADETSQQRRREGGSTNTSPISSICNFQKHLEASANVCIRKPTCIGSNNQNPKSLQKRASIPLNHREKLIHLTSGFKYLLCRRPSPRWTF